MKKRLFISILCIMLVFLCSCNTSKKTIEFVYASNSVSEKDVECGETIIKNRLKYYGYNCQVHADTSGVTISVPQDVDETIIANLLTCQGRFYLISQYGESGKENFVIHDAEKDSQNTELSRTIYEVVEDKGIIVENNQITNCELTKMRDADYVEQSVVNVVLDNNGQKAFAEATRRAFENRERIAFYLDKILYSEWVSAIILDGRFIIWRFENEVYAKITYSILKSGVLPYELVRKNVNGPAIQNDTSMSLEVPEDLVLQGYITDQWEKEFVVKSFAVNKLQVLQDYKTAYMVCTIEAMAPDGVFGKKEEWEMNLTYYDIGGWECTNIKKLNAGYQLLTEISEQECRSLITQDIPQDAKNFRVESLHTDKSTATARMTISYEYISDYFKDSDNVFGDVVHGYQYPEGKVFGSVTAKAQAVATFQYTDWERNSGWKKTNYQLTDNTEYIYNLRAHVTYESDALMSGQGGGIDFDIIVENNMVQISDGMWKSEGVNKASASIKLSNASIKWTSSEYGRFSDESHLCIRFSYDRASSDNVSFPAVSDTGYLSFFGGNLGSDSNHVILYLERSLYNTLWETWTYDEYAPTVEPL